MTTLNAYATLAEFKNYVRSRGGSVADDNTDDTVMEFLLRSASQYIESQTDCHFIPRIETRYYDVPDGNELDPRQLNLDGDLLEVITLTNGDGTVIPSTEYTLRPKNSTPYYGIRLKDNSTYIWASDGAGDLHDVISVLGVWGFHNHYSTAWTVGSTAAEAMDATETGYDVTSGALFAVGNLIRFDDELGYVSAVAANSLTTTRGENGSTATTHLTSIDVKIWNVMEDAKNSCIELVNNMYRRRFGQSSTSNSEQITAAGIVISPRDVPAMVKEFIATYRRYV